MEWYSIMSLLFGGMVLLLLTGIPIAFAFLIVNMVAAYFFLGGVPGLIGVVTGVFTSITTFTLLPVPFFILMGELIFHSGLGLDAVNVLDKWLGKLRGRLSILAIIMGVIIGALSGSTIATCALLGTILLPDMLKRGYSKHMSLGPLMGVGTVDALIPPNALTVVLASLAMIDVGQLLIAGILPGIIMSGLYLIYVVAWAHIRPHEAPIYDVPHVPVKEKVMATVQYLLPLGFIIFMVIGLIFLGVATPTEAAATGTLGSFILALLYGRLNWDALKKSVVGTIKVTTMIFMIIIVSNTYGEILAFTGAASGMTSYITSLPIPPIAIVIGMLIVVLILGAFMETVAIMMITIPIYMAVVNAFGLNPIWFGVLMLIALETGLITPPFGVTLFVMKGVAPPDVTMADIWRAIIPYVIIDILCIFIVLMMPSIATVVPNLMGMK
ncbi:MAG TPA: TRAP transporter large permease subunit [Syntrophorhabdus sp.]|nr:TRAP transporter large permease subunit [Syntrophorhabdus sp.]MDI9558581.1 TRAP transporter large permease subunit [Pseudomonadota bacterium]OPX93521.1 MAG: Sialic acid TRAP transporter permease protein SiaT [Syntrophorhabdus sp. PtaB.Bin027]OQB77638.1 MAG: Sialic acid TRAP transporter permease protein SiaT [Deltaproteobacteria bacterium ADurb.Bin135]NMC95534.1 TRAP transporter large permease subunit [Syntrophorhabdus sp.]